MRRMVLAGLACAGALALAVACMPGQRAAASAAPYKLGTFESGGRTFVGLVVNAAPLTRAARLSANAAFERDNASAPKLAMPGEMKALIGRYDEIRERLGLLAGAMGASSRPI